MQNSKIKSPRTLTHTLLPLCLIASVIVWAQEPSKQTNVPNPRDAESTNKMTDDLPGQSTEPNETEEEAELILSGPTLENQILEDNYNIDFPVDI